MNWMQKYRMVLSAFVLLLAASATLAAGHQQCEDCHASGTPSASNLVQPLSALCINCHQTRIDAGEHAVDIPANTTTTMLPLQAGRMTCVTCHDPHTQGIELCQACHRR